MVASSRLVIGVDGSAASLDAVRWGTLEAIRRHAPVELITTMVFVPASYSSAFNLRGAVFTDQEVEAKKVIAKAVDVVHDTAVGIPVTLDTRIVKGQAAEVLLELDEVPAMIVLGSRGLGEFTGGLIGSVSSAVVTHAKCPVAVVKSGGTSHGPVVVGVDNTPSSQPAIGVALEEASLRGVDLVAVHAWSDLELGSVFTRDGDSEQWWDSDLAEDESLAESMAGWSQDYPDVTIRRVVACDNPTRELSREAEAAQLIVVGSRGRGGFTSLLLGSTSRGVLHAVDIPVIVVPTGR